MQTLVLLRTNPGICHAASSFPTQLAFPASHSRLLRSICHFQRWKCHLLRWIRHMPCSIRRFQRSISLFLRRIPDSRAACAISNVGNAICYVGIVTSHAAFVVSAQQRFLCARQEHHISVLVLVSSAANPGRPLAQTLGRGIEGIERRPSTAHRGKIGVASRKKVST